MPKSRRKDDNGTLQEAERENESLRTRLAHIVERYSQSEVARRTNTPVSNVHRYLRMGRVPGDFLGALVRELGVNANWLLTGEGSPFHAQVQAKSASTAGDLLEVLRAMNAVARMKLGELTGDTQLKLLAEFHEKLTTYEKLRAELNERTRPYLERLIAELSEATRLRDYTRAGEIRESAVQVARLCDDEELRRRLDLEQYRLDLLRGARERALEFQRSVYLRYLPRTELADEESLKTAYNYGIALVGAGRLREARRVCRTALMLAPAHIRRGSAALSSISLASYLDAELGQLRRALANMERFTAAAPAAADAQAMREVHLRSLLFAGVITLREACTFGDGSRQARATMMFEFACLNEVRDDLVFMIKHFDSMPGGTAPPLPRFLSEAMLSAMDGGIEAGLALLDANARAVWNGLTPPSAHDLVFDIARAKVLRLGGRPAPARTHTLRAHKRMAQLPAHASLSIVIRVLQAHNILALGSGQRNAQWNAMFGGAHRLFRHLIRRGYRMFEPLYVPYATGKMTS